METKQIAQILDGAPEGATHCTDTVPSMNLYAKVEHLGGFYVSLSNRWESYPIYAGVHLLSDLREILNLRQRVAELELQNTRLRKIFDESPDLTFEYVKESFKEELDQYTNELAATVERLRSISEAEYADEDERIADIQGALESTPQQSLAEHDAEVIQRFLNREASLLNPDGLDPDEHCCECILHDERMRLHNLAQRIKDGE